MKIEDCEGCRTIKDRTSCGWYHESLTCPCSICLIKVMCITQCDLLLNYINKNAGLGKIQESP